MKREKQVRHRIEQKTALRKNDRRRRRHLFRLGAKAERLQVVEAIKEANEKKGITYEPKRQRDRQRRYPKVR